MSPDRLHRRFASLVGALALVGCNFDQQGIPPVPATLNFPIALGLSVPQEGVAARHLFVVNSNFDLRFNEGTLMALDLDRIAGTGATGDRGLLASEGCSDVSPCIFDDLSGVLSDEVGVGSHGDGLQPSSDGGRLYIAGRSTQNLTFVDWNAGSASFECEADDPGAVIPRCGEHRRRGSDGPVTSQRELELDGDPVDVATGRLEDIGGAEGSGDFVLLALRDGRVALFVEQGVGAARVPVLVHIAGGFPPSLVTLTMQPGTGIGWLTSAASRTLGRVGIAVDARDPTRSFLYNAGAVTLGGLDDGLDTRDIEFDPVRPEERAFLLARRPESVVTIDLTRAGLNAGDVGLGDIYEVGAGPSRLAVARLDGRTYVLATTFNARKLYIIDVAHGAVIGVVGGVSGPFELVVDEPRRLLYVADFAVSVIRVFDLEPLTRDLSPFLLATVGNPTPVEGFTD